MFMPFLSGMVVTTRSQAKKADKSGISESKSESGEINEKTWGDWMTNRVVMDKARELWLKEIFRKKLCAENPALSGRALSTRKVARKTSKHTRESVYSHACLSFRDDYYDNYFMTHPDEYILTPEVMRGADRAWPSLADGVKAAYFVEAKKRLADGDEVCYYIQHNQAYMDQLYTYML